MFLALFKGCPQSLEARGGMSDLEVGGVGQEQIAMVVGHATRSCN